MLYPVCKYSKSINAVTKRVETTPWCSLVFRVYNCFLLILQEVIFSMTKKNLDLMLCFSRSSGQYQRCIDGLQAERQNFKANADNTVNKIKQPYTKSIIQEMTIWSSSKLVPVLYRGSVNLTRCTFYTRSYLVTLLCAPGSTLTRGCYATLRSTYLCYDLNSLDHPDYSVYDCSLPPLGSPRPINRSNLLHRVVDPFSALLHTVVDPFSALRLTPPNFCKIRN
jgi:hypothetical protein